MLRSHVLAGARAVLVFTLLLGVAFPLLVTGAAKVVFPRQAAGSLVRHNGVVVGSSLIGQAFDGPQWFNPRPSAAGDGYDAAASAPSNLGPSNPLLLKAVGERAAAYRTDNGLDAATKVPVDAVTASGSGLDPHISIANARLQAPRVARTRDLPIGTVLELVRRHTDPRPLGVLGEPGVNVLAVNIALADLARSK